MMLCVGSLSSDWLVTEKPALVAQLDARSTGDQEVAG